MLIKSRDTSATAGATLNHRARINRRELLGAGIALPLGALAPASHAAGEVIRVRGRVLDPDCKPIEGALVDLWQADSNGRHSHPAAYPLEFLDGRPDERAGYRLRNVPKDERPKLVIAPNRSTGQDPPLYTFDLTIARG
jgi:hypothetical protein